MTSRNLYTQREVNQDSHRKLNKIHQFLLYGNNLVMLNTLYHQIANYETMILNM